MNLGLAMQRKYHIVLLGATGFTGGLIVEYMTATFPGSLRWAIAARNKTKLEAVAREFKVEATGGELVFKTMSLRSILIAFRIHYRSGCELGSRDPESCKVNTGHRQRNWAIPNNLWTGSVQSMC